jgi:glucose/arabinose dehydrogenase
LRLLLLASLIFTVFSQPTNALPPCADRPTYSEVPQVNAEHYCLELVMDDPSAGELAYTALATAPDGSLYATRPLTGELLILEDTNADGLPDASRQLATGLTLPNALVFTGDKLLIAGGSHIYQWQTETGIEVLVDNLPIGTGFWTGGIAVDKNGRIYVGIGAACDPCITASQPASRGVILSFAPDGTDRQVVATGFRQPAGLTWWQNALWVTDNAPTGLDSGSYDELNRVDSFQGQDFGFPDCVTNSNLEETDCGGVIPPVFTFPTTSNPISLTPYNSMAFPELTGSLLVVLNGSYNDSRLRGYEIGAIHFDETGHPSIYETLIPDLATFGLQYQGSGFFPHRPYGIAVSPEGWIYISIGGGKIYAIRPL